MPKRCRAVLHRHPVVVGALVFSLMFASVGLSLAIPASAQPGQTDPSQSTISASPLEVPADGQTASTITVTLVDDTGTAVVGDDVSVTDSTGNSSCTSASPCTAVSNGSGKAQVQVVDSTVESDVFSAVDITQNVAIAQSSTIQFVTSESSTFVGTLDEAECLTTTECFLTGSTEPGTTGDGVLLETTDSGSSWFTVSLPIVDGDTSGLQAAFCLQGSSDCWFGSSNGTVFMTTNSGATWSSVNIGSVAVAAISCVSTSTCWLTDGFTGGSIWQSTDGGVTWSPQVQTGSLGNIFCADSLHCVAVTTSAFNTSDGGTTWTQSSLPAQGEMSDVYCTSDEDCLAAGDLGGGSGEADAAILQSTDGGTTWQTVLDVGAPNERQVFRGVYCVSQTRCLAAGGYGDNNGVSGVSSALLYQSTDGGDTWQPLTLPSLAAPYTMYRVRCVSSAFCLVPGQETVQNSGAGAVLVSIGLTAGGSAQTGTNGVSFSGVGGTDASDVITEAQYGSNPVSGALDGSTNYFDVAVSANSSYSSAVLADCNDVDSSTVMEWWDSQAASGSGAWQPIVGDPGPTFSPGPPACVDVTFDSTTTPSLSELTGTVLGTASANSSVSQTISWPSEPTSGVKGGSVTLSATGGGSDNPVVYKIDSTSGSGVCSVSGTNGKTLSYTGIGTCVVDANQAGNSGYSAAPQVQDTFSVTSCSDTATRCFTSAPSHSASVGSQFSFPVTTAGSPTPKITEKGKLPKGVTFNKTTDIVSGTPTSTKHKAASGTYSLTFTARFGKGKNKVVVTQSFLLTVT